MHNRKQLDLMYLSIDEKNINLAILDHEFSTFYRFLDILKEKKIFFTLELNNSIDIGIWFSFYLYRIIGIRYHINCKLSRN